jgi:hypothetical protein
MDVMARQSVVQAAKAAFGEQLQLGERDSVSGLEFGEQGASPAIVSCKLSAVAIE